MYEYTSMNRGTFTIIVDGMDLSAEPQNENIYQKLNKVHKIENKPV